MDKNISKQEIIEKDFHKTRIGKFMRDIAIVAVVCFAIGLIIGIFEGIVYAKNLDINKYQTIITIGELCMENGGKASFWGMLFYAAFLPALTKENEEKKDKVNKKAHTIITMLFSLIMIAPILKLIYGLISFII